MIRKSALILALTSLFPASAIFAQAEHHYRYRVPLAQSEAALAPASLVLSPSDLSFSDQVVGSSSASAFVLQNKGAQPLTFSSIKASNASEFILDSSACPAALAPGDMCAVGMSFAPRSRGTFSGTLLVDYVGGSAQATYSGRGLQGVLQASSSALVFDPVILPDTSSRSIQISNTGDATVSSVSITADAPFVASGSCATITQGQSCSVSVRYEPAAPGAANGTLQITSPVGSLSVQLSGSAAAGESIAAVTAGNPTLFGSVVQGAAPIDRVVSLRNDGNVAMSITGIQGLPAVVSVRANTCENVAPGATCSLTLRLGTAAPASFTNTIAATQGASSNANLSLSGDVQAAQSIVQIVSGNPITFGSVAQNAAAVDRSVSLRNTGNSPLSISGFVGLPSGVSVLANDCSSIAPNATCSVTFRLATSAVTSFSNVNVASQGGTTNATLSMSGAVAAAGYPASAFSLRSVDEVEMDEDYNQTYVAGRSVYVRNGSGAALTISTVNFCPESRDRAEMYIGVFTTAWVYSGSSDQPFCSVRTINRAWANGSEFALYQGAAYGDYGAYPNAVYRPAGNGYIAIKLSNGQTIEVRSSGVVMK